MQVLFKVQLTETVYICFDKKKYHHVSECCDRKPIIFCKTIDDKFYYRFVMMTTIMSKIHTQDRTVWLNAKLYVFACINDIIIQVLKASRRQYIRIRVNNSYV